MKKVMFGFAAAAAVAAMAIESANTVGYMNNGETVAGLNLVGPGFQDVGVTSIKLTGLKVTNAQGGEVGTGTCEINLIDSIGNTLATYSWKSSGRGANKTWGWKEGDDAVADTVTLAPGQAILFTAESAGDKLIFPAQE